jgi:regulator of protease activity HflC (stomatin/prohibitin superfamily)
MHVLVLVYGVISGQQRGVRVAGVHLAAFDWALIMGVSAGRLVAGEGTPFWSLDTVTWGLLGAFWLFLPAWLLFRFGLRLNGTLLLPVVPTEREQRRQAGRTLHAYTWGLNYPYYREENGELRKLVGSRIPMHGTLLHEGGPGLVLASSHYAIPLTVGTRDTQVGGHGVVFTGHRERPHSLVDLRLQARTKTVQALTRDGIPVKVVMTAVFQIDRRKAKDEGLYPFDPQAVFAAVHAEGIGPKREEEEEKPRWEQIVVDRAADLLRDAISRTLLDRLLESDDRGTKPPRETLRAGVKKELAQVMESHGVEVIAVSLGNLEVEDEEVLRQRVENWRAIWERRRLEKEAQGDAEAIRLIEEARADAQSQTIEIIIKAFQQLVDTGTPVPAQVIALRFIDVLEEVATASPVQELLPETVQELPARLRLLMKRFSAGESEQTAQPAKGSK